MYASDSGKNKAESGRRKYKKRKRIFPWRKFLFLTFFLHQKIFHLFSFLSARLPCVSVHIVNLWLYAFGRPMGWQKCIKRVIERFQNFSLFFMSGMHHMNTHEHFLPCNIYAIRKNDERNSRWDENFLGGRGAGRWEAWNLWNVCMKLYINKKNPDCRRLAVYRVFVRFSIQSRWFQSLLITQKNWEQKFSFFHRREDIAKIKFAFNIGKNLYISHFLVCATIFFFRWCNK